MELSETVYADVKGVLTELASQLGTGVETFWPEFVKVQLWAPIACIVLLILLWGVGITLLYYGGKKNDDDIMGPGLLLILFSVIPLFALLVDKGRCLLSPEYCALKEVLNLLN